MVGRLRIPLVALGAALTLVGVVLTVIYLFQPWRSCPYDDSPAACAMLPGDFAVMSASMLGAAVGAVVLAIALIPGKRTVR